VACVDDAEPVAFRVSKYDEIWIGRVVPRHARGAEADQALDLVGMFSGVIDDEVEMCSWTFLGRGIGSMQRDARSLTRWRHEDREFVLGIREPNRSVPKNARPERHCSVDIIGTEHDRSKSNHDVSVTPMTGPNDGR
jgi:hypothetical protein